MNHKLISMDNLDYKALAFLMNNGRAAWSDLAELLGMSAPAAAERVRKLEESGVIKGYTAMVDPASVGLSLTAFIEVTLERPQHRTKFLAKIASLSEVQECHHVTGDYDYLLKIRCVDTTDLDRVISDEIKNVVGVTKTKTSITLSTKKEIVKLALRAESN